MRKEDVWRAPTVIAIAIVMAGCKDNDPPTDALGLPVENTTGQVDPCPPGSEQIVLARAKQDAGVDAYKGGSGVVEISEEHIANVGANCSSMLGQHVEAQDGTYLQKAGVNARNNTEPVRSGVSDDMFPNIPIQPENPGPSFPKSPPTPTSAIEQESFSISQEQTPAISPTRLADSSIPIVVDGEEVPTEKPLNFWPPSDPVLEEQVSEPGQEEGVVAPIPESERGYRPGDQLEHAYSNYTVDDSKTFLKEADRHGTRLVYICAGVIAAMGLGTLFVAVMNIKNRRNQSSVFSQSALDRQRRKSESSSGSELVGASIKVLPAPVHPLQALREEIENDAEYYETPRDIGSLWFSFRTGRLANLLTQNQKNQYNDVMQFVEEQGYTYNNREPKNLRFIAGIYARLRSVYPIDRKRGHLSLEELREIANFKGEKKVEVPKQYCNSKNYQKRAAAVAKFQGNKNKKFVHYFYDVDTSNLGAQGPNYLLKALFKRTEQHTDTTLSGNPIHCKSSELKKVIKAVESGKSWKGRRL